MRLMAKLRGEDVVQEDRLRTGTCGWVRQPCELPWAEGPFGQQFWLRKKYQDFWPSLLEFGTSPRHP